jgi:hypothetical protein
MEGHWAAPALTDRCRGHLFSRGLRWTADQHHARQAKKQTVARQGYKHTLERAPAGASTVRALFTGGPFGSSGPDRSLLRVWLLEWL